VEYLQVLNLIFKYKVVSKVDLENYGFIVLPFEPFVYKLVIILRPMNSSYTSLGGKLQRLH